VLVVSETRSQEYRISEARAECTRDEARLVGGSDSDPAVAVEKADPLRPPIEWSAKRGIVRMIKALSSLGNPPACGNS
jgi:hypothetical protein